MRSISPRIRDPVVADKFYPRDKDQLNQFISQALEECQQNSGYSDTNAVIVPHAGYQYSGTTAAKAFAKIRPNHFDKVILLGPSHYVRFHGLSIGPFDKYRTPLGTIDVDNDVSQQLCGGSDLICRRSDIHRFEHCIEVELPFIQRIAPRSKIVPIVIGELSAAEVTNIADILFKLWQDSTLIVVSSDFTHYGKEFGYYPFPQDQAPKKLKELDHGAIEKIVAKDAQGFLDYVEDTGATICGRLPIAILLAMVENSQKSYSLDLLQYTCSGTISGDFRNSVSYASIVFKPGNKSLNPNSPLCLSQKEKSLLLAVAHQAIQSKLQRKIFALPLGLSPNLVKTISVFVTLRIGGKLRGCMGNISQEGKLAENVATYASSAAFEDPRFAPLSFEEEGQLQIEISCLTPLKPISSISEIVVGKHGIVLENGNHRSLFLPQVAIEQNWDKETTLEHLSQKAGLSPLGWSQKATQLSVFEAIKFSDYS